jgi:hypothetical protein
MAAVREVSGRLPGGATGREMSGFGLRALLAVATFALVLTTLVNLAGGGFGPVPVAFAVVAAGAVAGFPASPAATVVACLVVVLYGTSVPEFGLAAVAVASLLHTAHVLAGLAEVVPARARVELPALQPSVRRWSRVQLLTVPVLVMLTLVV